MVIVAASMELDLSLKPMAALPCKIRLVKHWQQYVEYTYQPAQWYRRNEIELMSQFNGK